MKESFVVFGTRSLLCLIIAIGGSLYAQQDSHPKTVTASPSRGFTLKTSVSRVLVDVTVTDAHGDPAHGLSEDDFLVSEDGKPQTVLSFDAYNFDKGMDYMPPNLPSMPPDTFFNLPADPERGPLYVLLYDLVNIPQKDQVFARAQLVKFIDDKPAGARFAILVSSDGVHVVQGFTSDQRELLAVVNPKGTRAHVPEIFMMGENFGEGDGLAASARLNSIARYLAPMTGRKILIWFASEFPLSLFPSTNQTELYREEAKKTLDLLADNQIAVYPVDVSGVVIAEAYAPPGDMGDEGTKSSAAASQSNHGVSLVYSSFMKQDEIAKMTGGKAVYSSNDLVGSLEKVTEQGGSYYTLAYSPSNKNFDGHLRHIEVKLKEGKYHLAYRRAYYGASADAVGEPVDDTLSASMKHRAPEYHQLVFEVHVVPTGAPERGTKEQMMSIAKAQGEKDATRSLKPVQLQKYTVDYAIMAKPLRAEGDTDPQFEIAVAAYDADGRLLNSVVNMTVKSDPVAGEHAAAQDVYRVEQELDAPLDAKFMRFAVRDVRSGKVGAMELPLPLPPAN